MSVGLVGLGTKPECPEPRGEGVETLMRYPVGQSCLANSSMRYAGERQNGPAPEQVNGGPQLTSPVRGDWTAPPGFRKSCGNSCLSC